MVTNCSAYVKYSLEPPEISSPCVSAIEWNCNGSLLAVSYGYRKHQKWCYHKGAIGVWEATELSTKEQKPEWYLPTSECYLDVSFHPSSVRLLATAKVNGGIELIDLSSAEDYKVLFSIDDEIAQPQLRSVYWLQGDDSSGRAYLASCSTPGIVQLFSLTADKQLKLKRSFCIPQSRLPKVFRGAVQSNWPNGLVDIAFLTGTSGDFVTACESGALFLCNLNSKEHANVLVAEQFSKILYDPAQMAFDCHPSEIGSIQSNAKLENVFCTSELDGVVKVFVSPSSTPIRQYYVEKPTHIFWSNEWPSIFGCTSATGVLFLFDLLEDQCSPIFKFQICDTTVSKDHVTLASMSPVDSRQIACSGGGARVNVWQLSSQLSNETVDHRRAFGSKYM